MNLKMANSLLPSALSLTVLVSPEVQTMLGNGVGQSGFWFFPALLIAALMQLLTVKLYHHLGTKTEISSGTELIANNFGHPVALFFTLTGRVVFMATVSTIILATAGFVFNEVFLYWFPNFGFAFLLLFLTVAANMMGQRFANHLQLVLVALVFLAMLILAVACFIAPGVQEVGQTTFVPRAMLMPFLMIIGLELFRSSHCGAAQNSESARFVVAALFIAVMVFIFWGGAMLEVVSPEKLANSYIPHTKAARRALGQPGRIIAGIMIIAGVAATVNGLLLALTRQITDLARTGKIPRFLAKGGRHFPLSLFLLAACPATLMAMGMAGEEITEVYIRASLLFWLLHYSCIHLAAYRLDFPGKRLYLFASLFFLAVVAGLAGTDPERVELFHRLAYIGIGSIIISLCTYYYVTVHSD